MTCKCKDRRGFCLWFTGLSGAGKSTIAQIVNSILLEYGKTVTMLDGDVVRTNLSKGLGFSKEDRDINILRIGFVASEIVKHNGVAICAAISPFEDTRQKVKAMLGDNFIEIFVNTSLQTCEARDVKGLYKQARSGQLPDFTGIDSPYEKPTNPDIVLQTENSTPVECANTIIAYLKAQGFIA